MPSLDIAAIRGLADRVRVATGPDRELDERILCALLAPANAFVEQSRFNGAWVVMVPSWKEGRPANCWETPNPWRQDHGGLTASLDAALALAMQADPSRPKRAAAAWLRYAVEEVLWTGRDPAPQAPDPIGQAARAVVFCLLSAILAQEADAGGEQHGW